MRILKESEINYSIEDIIDAINDELGFSAIKVSSTLYRFALTNSYKLMVDFDDEISIYLKLNDDTIDVSEGTAEVEALVTACESSIEIVNIIERMTTGGAEDDYS